MTLSAATKTSLVWLAHSLVMLMALGELACLWLAVALYLKFGCISLFWEMAFVVAIGGYVVYTTLRPSRSRAINSLRVMGGCLIVAVLGNYLTSAGK